MSENKMFSKAVVSRLTEKGAPADVFFNNFAYIK